jgi:hypothetical protein
MVINNLDFMRVAFMPGEADAPLIVDSYAMLSFPDAFKCFQAIPRRHPKVVQVLGAINEHQLDERSSLYFRRKLA